MNINVPAHVINQDAYVRGAEARIRNNARIGRRRRWMSDHQDAQRLSDWLSGTNEFSGHWEMDGVVVSEKDRDDDEYVWNHSKYIHNPMCLGKFSGEFGEFLIGLSKSLDDFGSLTDKQTQVVRDALARKEGWVATAAKNRAAALEADRNSRHVGTIKERRDWELTISKVLSFDGEWGIVYINLMKDQSGNVIVGKGTKRYGEVGDVVKVKATIVKHDSRDGIAQTMINRPKF